MASKQEFCHDKNGGFCRARGPKILAKLGKKTSPTCESGRVVVKLGSAHILILLSENFA